MHLCRCNIACVNGIDLFLLGRTLMKIGEEALPADGVGRHPTGTRTVLIVASDIRDHPGSAVGEIAARTGFPQSAVSGAVARLRDAEAITTQPDPGDRRRVLIHPAAEASDRMGEVRAASIETALAATLGTDDPLAIGEVTSLLEELARRLTPDVIGQLRKTQPR